jgi:hypothetical protein
MCSNKKQRTQPASSQAQPPVDFNQTFLCETVFEKSSTKQVDTRDLSSSAAASLKTSDPFMFYSIPQLRKAALLNKGSDDLPQHVPANLSGSSSMDTAAADGNGSCLVKRQTRVSTECHADLFFEDFLGLHDNQGETDCEDDSDDDDEEEAFLMAILAAKANQASA